MLGNRPILKRYPGTKNEALEIFGRLGIEPDSDFHTLPSRMVEDLIWEADKANYRKPRNASGSRARCFHERLSRLARDRDFWGYI